MQNMGIVEDTLFVPLLGRIYASERFPNILRDDAALSLKDRIPAISRRGAARPSTRSSPRRRARRTWTGSWRGTWRAIRRAPWSSSGAGWRRPPSAREPTG